MGHLGVSFLNLLLLGPLSPLDLTSIFYQLVVVELRMMPVSERLMRLNNNDIIPLAVFHSDVNCIAHYKMKVSWSSWRQWSSRPLVQVPRLKIFLSGKQASVSFGLSPAQRNQSYPTEIAAHL